VPIVLKSGSLNFLEPSGPVQACNGIALLFYEDNCLLEFGAVWTGGSVPMFQSILLLPGRQQNALGIRHIDNILHAITLQEITIFNISIVKKYYYND
jgi:hypothetical protein